MGITGRLEEFRSPLDGLLHPCAIAATDDAPEPKPLLIEVSPAALDDLPRAVALTDEIATIAAAAGRSCVVLRPTGRGPGSVYQDYGEVDVLEAIEFAAGLHAIDRDRISVTLTWGSHLNLALLPDYLVYAHGETLDWGFWGNDWHSQDPH